MNYRVCGTWRALVCAGATLLGCSSLDEGGGLMTGACTESGAAPVVAAQNEQAEAFERRVLELTNQRRAAGGCCGGEGCFEPSAPLVASENLQAAARLHARDMSERNFFAHDSPDGRSLVDRAGDAGFGGCALGENIAQGQSTPEQVVDSWLASDGHCTNVLFPGFTSLGVGFFDDPTAEQRRLWVQNFGG